VGRLKDAYALAQCQIWIAYRHRSSCVPWSSAVRHSRPRGCCSAGSEPALQRTRPLPYCQPPSSVPAVIIQASRLLASLHQSIQQIRLYGRQSRTITALHPHAKHLFIACCLYQEIRSAQLSVYGIALPCPVLCYLQQGMGGQVRDNETFKYAAKLAILVSEMESLTNLERLPAFYSAILDDEEPGVCLQWRSLSQDVLPSLRREHI